MADEAFVLSDRDRQLIQELLLAHKGRGFNTRQRPREGGVDHQEMPGPEVYIARTPTDGIPALIVSAGTGLHDQPGFADCYTYRLATWDSPVDIYPTDNAPKTVYNLSSSAVPGDTWVLIIRDKFGSWMVVTGGGSGDSTFLALLLGKTYGGTFISYRWEETTDTDSIVYTEGARSGGPGSFPAYHVRNLDLPVVPGDSGSGTGTGSELSGIEEAHEPLSVVRMWQGAGNYYLFNTDPWEDIFLRTGVFDDYGEKAFHYYKNQATNLWVAGREVRLVDPPTP